MTDASDTTTTPAVLGGEATSTAAAGDSTVAVSTAAAGDSTVAASAPDFAQYQAALTAIQQQNAALQAQVAQFAPFVETIQRLRAPPAPEPDPFADPTEAAVQQLQARLEAQETAHRAFVYEQRLSAETARVSAEMERAQAAYPHADPRDVRDLLISPQGRALSVEAAAKMSHEAFLAKAEAYRLAYERTPAARMQRGGTPVPAGPINTAAGARAALAAAFANDDALWQ